MSDGIYTDGTIEKAVNHAQVGDDVRDDCLLSIAISMKRIADVLEAYVPHSTNALSDLIMAVKER